MFCRIVSVVFSYFTSPYPSPYTDLTFFTILYHTTEPMYQLPMMSLPGQSTIRWCHAELVFTLLFFSYNSILILILILNSFVTLTCLHVCLWCSGNLPPEARQMQAKLFEDPESAWNVLVATDAVGLGLNLAISRIVFTSLSKFDGVKRRSLNSSVSGWVDR